MPNSGSSIFSDADGYAASLCDMLDLLALRPRDFKARLTWLELSTVSLLRAEESAARLARWRLPPRQAHFIFPAKPGTKLIVDGVELAFGDAMFHRGGHTFHEQTTGASVWGSIAVAHDSLATLDQVFAGSAFRLPPASRIIRMPDPARRKLLHLHAAAGRVAETNLVRIRDDNTARAIEQDLFLAWADCMRSDAATDFRDVHRRQGDLCGRLELLMAAEPHAMATNQALCDALGVSYRTLRKACTAVLGLSAVRYQRLRRLKRVRDELLHGTPEANVAGLIARYGYSDLHRFVTEYWNIFGEMPPVAPRNRAPEDS